MPDIENSFCFHFKKKRMIRRRETLLVLRK
jgi:hypothetical protein